ncbi:MAG: Rieske 2Fe-2S domain-containing protein [Pirellulales bacterium]|nr:Rieske 2Fe-2S domain-containing protein [Pirellulales bacterium]
MSSLDTPSRPRSAAAGGLGLPPCWYLDPAVYEAERELIDASPRFVGRSQMAPRDGDYVALEGANSGSLIVRHQGEVRLVSNVCRHRQAIMLHGRGNAKRIVCPIHNWAYGLDGRQCAAPHFPENPCLNLPAVPLNEWRGLLFAGLGDPAADLAALDDWPELNADGYVLDRIDYEEHELNWKSFMEVYLEDYHVSAVHPGFRTFVSPEDLRSPKRSAHGERFYAEMVGARWPLGSPGSPQFAEYQRLLLEVTGGMEPEYGAIWLSYFPSTLVEWYPFFNIITCYTPLSAERTALSSQYYVRRDVRESRPDLVEACHAVLDEVTAEDHEASVRLHAGRRALWRQGERRQGPYQDPMEQGLRHFHDFLRVACPAFDY